MLLISAVAALAVSANAKPGPEEVEPITDCEVYASNFDGDVVCDQWDFDDNNIYDAALCATAWVDKDLPTETLDYICDNEGNLWRKTLRDAEGNVQLIANYDFDNSLLREISYNSGNQEFPERSIKFHYDRNDVLYRVESFEGIRQDDILEIWSNGNDLVRVKRDTNGDGKYEQTWDCAEHSLSDFFTVLGTESYETKFVLSFFGVTCYNPKE